MLERHMGAAGAISQLERDDIKSIHKMDRLNV
jgi:hypothetical protein